MANSNNVFFTTSRDCTHFVFMCDQCIVHCVRDIEAVVQTLLSVIYAGATIIILIIACGDFV